VGGETQGSPGWVNTANAGRAGGGVRPIEVQRKRRSKERLENRGDVHERSTQQMTEDNRGVVYEKTANW